jgi:F-type H+-transporting ATPase subunit delta
MRDKVVARRYAAGFMSYARENIGLEKAFEELAYIKQLVIANLELSEFLENTEIDFSEKQQVIENVFKNAVSGQTKLFLEFLIKKGRIGYIAEITDYSQDIFYNQKGIKKALLKVSSPLDVESILVIKERLEKKLHKKLELKVKRDPELIGGVQVIAGNIIVDDSVKRKLEELKRKLIKVKVN